MIIRDVRITPRSVPWVEPPVYFAGCDRRRAVLMLEPETDGGMTGMGFMQPSSGGLRTVAACLREQIIPAGQGRDLTRVEALW